MPIDIPALPTKTPLRDLRYRARLAAVQGLYRMDIASDDLDDVISDFLNHHLGDGGPDSLGEADDEHFAFLLRGVTERQVEIDRAIESQLAAGWTLPRLDTTARAILRSAVFELLGAASVPARVILDEYVSIADSFFDDAEVRFVNGVLDALARRFRPQDMNGPKE